MRVVAVLAAAKWLARLIATVVFPAPPFGLITSVVFILITGDPHPFYCRYAGHHATWQSEMQMSQWVSLGFFPWHSRRTKFHRTERAWRQCCEHAYRDTPCRLRQRQRGV